MSGIVGLEKERGDLMDAKKIGKNIRKLRLEQGLNTEQLAQKVGLTVRSIDSYERGERIPSDGGKLKIANALDSSVQNIFFDNITTQGG